MEMGRWGGWTRLSVVGFMWCLVPAALRPLFVCTFSWYLFFFTVHFLDIHFESVVVVNLSLTRAYTFSTTHSHDLI